MAKTVDEWLDWLDSHPGAYVFVAEDVWDVWHQSAADTDTTFALNARDVRKSKYLQPGMIVAMTEPDSMFAKVKEPER